MHLRPLWVTAACGLLVGTLGCSSGGDPTSAGGEGGSSGSSARSGSSSGSSPGSGSGSVSGRSPGVGPDADTGNDCSLVRPGQVPESACTPADPFWCFYLDQGTNCQGAQVGTCESELVQVGDCILATCPTGSTIVSDAGCPPATQARCSPYWQPVDEPFSCCFAAQPDIWGEYSWEPGGSAPPGCTVIVADAGGDAP